MKYSIVGLGKLGASMAAAIASRGFNVIGVDVNQRSVDLLNAGRAPVQETNLDETIAANKERVRATRSHEEAIRNSDLTFVIVPTPSDDRGAFSLQYAAWAFKEIGRALAKKKDYHVVVLTSTVLPGSMRYGLLPILEKESGKVCGRDFGLCYSPEFIALGSIIRDFLNPDFTLIGEFDERCGKVLEDAYAGIMLNNPPSKRMSLENAELTKITVNAFAPGVVVTPLWDGLEQDMIDKGVIKRKGEFIESFSSSILLGYPARPSDIAGIAAFLASADSDYITGQVIMADGGMVLV